MKDTLVGKQESSESFEKWVLFVAGVVATEDVTIGKLGVKV
jgi:hypothetical protein